MNDQPSQTYGHEQRHVRNMVEKASSLMKDADKRLSKINCDNKRLCEIGISRIKSSINTDWVLFKSKEAGHPGIPAAGTGYAPFNMIFPKEPSNAN